MSERRASEQEKRRPGGPQRDHTLRPVGEVDPDESPLPEGPQPTRKTARRSWLLALALLVIFLVVTTAVYFMTGKAGRLIPALVGAAVTGLIGAIPVLLAWWLRRKERERLNK